MASWRRLLLNHYRVHMGKSKGEFKGRGQQARNVVGIKLSISAGPPKPVTTSQGVMKFSPEEVALKLAQRQEQNDIAKSAFSRSAKSKGQAVKAQPRMPDAVVKARKAFVPAHKRKDYLDPLARENDPRRGRK